MNTKTNSKGKILFVDFDHTCYDTDSLLFEGIREPLLNSFNIPVSKFEESYMRTVKAGYTLEGHLDEINKLIGFSICSITDIQNIKKNIKFADYLYADTISFFKEAREKGYKIILLSFGAIGWNDLKVIASGLHKMVDAVKYTKEEGGKKSVLEQYVNDFDRIIFIDNHVVELDKVYERFPNVETYLMNRVPPHAVSAEEDEYLRARYLESRMMAEKESIFKHQKCVSFRDIIL